MRVRDEHKAQYLILRRWRSSPRSSGAWYWAAYRTALGDHEWPPSIETRPSRDGQSRRFCNTIAEVTQQLPVGACYCIIGETLQGTSPVGTTSEEMGDQ